MSVPATAMQSPKPAGRHAGPPPLTLDNLDLVSDFYVWDSDVKEKYLESFCFIETIDPTFLHDENTGECSPIGEWFRGVLQFIQRHHKREVDFSIIYPDPMTKGEYVFRVHRDVTTMGTQLCIRRVKEEVPQIIGNPATSLLFANKYVPYFMNAERLVKGGIGLFASKPGSGKSTTMAGVVRTRLETFSGMCKTIEAPVEMPLANRWGKGMCFQTAVDETLPIEQQYAKPMRAIALRGFPAIPGGGRTMVMLGEVRDPATAALVVQSAVGHLILTSIHGEDPVQACARLASMAGEVLGIDTARDMLASSLRFVVSQELHPNPSPRTKWDRRIIGGDFLWSNSYHSEAANNIRRGEFARLNHVVKSQRQKMDAAAASGALPSKVIEDLSQEVAAA